MAHWRKRQNSSISDGEMRMTLLAIFGMPAAVGFIAVVAMLLSLRNS